MGEQEYFCIRRGLFKKKKKLFSELEEKKKWQFLSANSESVYYLVKKKKPTKQGFRAIYINVEILHYFLI